MQRSHPSVASRFALMSLFATLTIAPLHAQLNFTISGGAWAPFLPDYEAIAQVVEGAGTPVQPNLFKDPQSDLGYRLGFSSMYQFQGTMTSLESETIYAAVDGMGSSSFLTDPDPLPIAPGGTSIWFPSLDGMGGNLATADGGSMTVTSGSDVRHFAKYIGLRDRFDLSRYGIGTLDLGCGFSYMTFDQDFGLTALVDTGAFGFYEEGLDSQYLGGQIRATFTRRIAGTAMMLDLRAGLYDLEVDYRGFSQSRTGGGFVFDTDVIALRSSDVAATFDITVKSEIPMCGILLRPTLGLQIFTEMASINHPQTETIAGPPVSLDSESAYMINGGFEAVF